MMSSALGILAAALGVVSVRPAEATIEPARARGLDRFFACAGPVRDAVPACLMAPRDGDHLAPPPGITGVYLDDPFPVAACFDAEFPPSLEVQQAVNNAMHGATTDRFVLNGRWPGANNTPITLTWSFVPDGVSIPSGTGEPVGTSELFAQMDARFADIGGRDAWIAIFQSVFDRWGALTGVRYQRVMFSGNPWDDGASWGQSGASGLRGSVRIGMKPIDGPAMLLAYNSYPTGGDMVLDSAENWASPVNDFRLLRNTVAHEHGHGLGLAHVCPNNRTKLMEPFLPTIFDGPQQDDIRGAQYSYGDHFEPNNTSAAASPIGTLTPGATLNPSAVPEPAIPGGSRTSMAINGDLDYFVFNVESPLLATVTAEPVGDFYPDYTQNSTCNNTTPNTNARNQADLALDVYASNGTSLLATAATAGFGLPKTAASVLLSPPGIYYVRVRELNFPTETQLYNLTITGALATFTASDGAFADRVRLNWGPIANTSAYTVFRGTTAARSSAVQVGNVLAPTLQFDDFPPQIGITYFYWLEATTSGASGSRTAAGPESGFRGSVPANNTCAGAAVIAAGTPAVFNSAQATTSGPAEGLCLSGSSGGGDQVSSDVWFRYTPLTSGRFTVDTCGSGFDTRLAVYAGACPTSPDAAIACNDQSPDCPGGPSSVRVAGLGGLTYFIRVGGAPGASGVGQVRVFCAADINRSGSVTLQDLFDFLALYFSSAAAADFNGDGISSVQDIFDMLVAYFSGC